MGGCVAFQPTLLLRFHAPQQGRASVPPHLLVLVLTGQIFVVAFLAVRANRLAERWTKK
jgi:hypothetical protein